MAYISFVLFEEFNQCSSSPVYPGSDETEVGLTPHREPAAVIAYDPSCKAASPGSQLLQDLWRRWAP